MYKNRRCIRREDILNLTTQEKRRYELGWLDVNKQMDRYQLECSAITTRQATAEELNKYRKMVKERRSRNEKSDFIFYSKKAGIKKV